MYDTIKIKHKHTPSEFRILEISLKSLGYIIENRFENTGTNNISVRYNYWNFTLTPKYLYCTGSLPQLLYGTNLVDFTITDTQHAIAKLNDILGVDVQNAEVTQLHFGCNIVVNQPVFIYLRLLGHKSGCKPTIIGAETVTFKGNGKRSGKEFAFYDKIAKQKDSGKTVSDQYANKHVLRYEMRLKFGIANKLGFDFLKLAELADASVYQTIKYKWYDEYTSIDKLSFNVPDFSINARQYTDYLMIETINSKGLTVVYTEIDAIFKSNYKVKSRLKIAIKKLTARASALAANVAIAELDNKITEVMEVVY